MTSAHTSRGLAVNFTMLAAGEIVAKVLTFLAFSYLARILGPARYGGLEFTLAVMVFFTLPVDLGLGHYGAREIAKGQNPARLLQEITNLRLLLALCSLGAVGVFIALAHRSTEVKLLLAAYGFSLLLCPVLLQWFFQGHGLMQWVALASVIRQSVFVGLIFVFVRPWTPLVYIGLAECISVAAVALFCLCLARFRMHFRLPLPTLHFSHAGHLRQSSPIGLTELAWAFTWYFATVLLGFTTADKSLGWFGASHRALMAMHTFVWLYLFNLLPSISRCVSLPREQLLTLLRRSLRFVTWTSLFAAFMLTLLSRQLLSLIYGPAFANGAPAFSVLVWMLPVSILSGHYAYTLIAYNLQKRLLYCTSIAAAVAVSLAFALVPSFGGVGAAWALLVANLVNLGLQYKSVQRDVAEVPFAAHLIQPVIGLAVAAVAFQLLAGLNRWMAAAVAATAYGCVFLLSQENVPPLVETGGNSTDAETRTET